MLKIDSQNCNKDTKHKIIHLFYEKHKRPTDISKKLKISMPYITKIIQKDNRYIEEKQERKDISKENQKDVKRRYIRKRRENEKQEYQSMIVQINKDNWLASKRKRMSNEKFAQCNRSIFEYDNNSSDLVRKQDINVGYNVPERVSHVVNASSIK